MPEELENGNLRKIYVVPHSHHDYAWVYERQWHIKRYCLIFSEVVDWLDENPAATWMIDNVIHSWRPFSENCPGKAQRFRELVKEGRIEISNGGYSLARPSYVGEETFVRNLQAADRYFSETFDVSDIPYYHNLDTAAGQRQMPQILSLAGFKYYRFQRPESALDQKKVPRTFRWKGLDGSKILVSRAFGGGFLSLDYTNLDFSADWEKAKASFFENELRYRRPDGLCPADIEMIYYGCDDSRPRLDWYDRKADIQKFIDEWNRREKVKIEFSLPKKYFSDLEKQDIPVYDGPLDESELTFNLPAKGDHGMWRRRGELDKLLVRLENVCTIASFCGEDYPEELIDRIWKQLFEITGHAIDYVHKQDDEDLTEIADNAETCAKQTIIKYLGKIASRCKYRENTVGVVVNTQMRSRIENVRLTVTSPTGLTGFRLIDSDGNRLPYQILRVNSHFNVPKEIRRYDYTSVDVLARVKVPAFGYTAVYYEPDGEPTPQREVDRDLIDCADSFGSSVEPLTVDNGRIIVTFECGKVKSVTDKKTDRTIYAKGDSSLCAPRCVKTGEYQTWMFENKITGEYTFTPVRWGLIENGALRWRYRVCGSFSENQKASFDIIINSGSPALEFELTLDTEPMNALYTFDVPCSSGEEVFADVYYGIERRRIEDLIYCYGENYMKGQIYGRNFVSFGCCGLPLSLVSYDCSVYYVQDTDRDTMSVILTRNCILDNSKEYWVRDLPDEFALSGKSHYRFSLLLNDAPHDFGPTQAYVKNYHHPLLVGAKYNSFGDNPDRASFLDILSCDAVQSAVFKKDGMTYLRMFETCGEERTWTVNTASPVLEAEAVDLKYRPDPNGVSVLFEGKEITITVKPFKIVTLRLKFREEFK